MPSRASLRRSLWFSAIGFAVLAVLVAATFWIAGRQEADQAWVTHTLEVRNHITRLFARLEEAESGQRGYIITGNPDYLPPYEAVAAGLGPDLDAIAVLVADNPVQSTALSRMRAKVDERMAVIADSVARQKRGDHEGAVAVVSSGRGKALMDDIRADIAQMLAEEERLLTQRRADVAETTSLLRAGLIAGFVLIVLLTLLAWVDASRRVREILAARDLLADANARLHAEAASRAVAEAQLRQSQKMEAVGQLTGGIAHDFNNMLAIIIGSLDLVRRRLRGDPDRAEAAIAHGLEGAQRAASLTARLLAFSRQQALAPTVCDVNKIVSGMSELLRRTLGETIEIESVLAGGLWRAFADCPQIETAILNLAVNGRDAMPDGGKLTIETANAYLDEAYTAQNSDLTPGQYVAICITDSGTGMSPQTVERAFDPFFTTKGVGRGTGLGLSQVFGFIKQSNGHVKIYSELGSGTTVKLYFPRYVGPIPVADELVSAVAAARGTETVLVVEDDDAVRRMTVEALRELGYTVIHASGGREALALFDKAPKIDLLFTDVVMPEMTGRVLADEALKLRPDLKVLYATGYTRNAVVHNGMLDAGVAFLTKPFTMEQLAQKVRAVLDGGGVYQKA